MFCTNCGSQLPDEKVKFCPNCGVRITEEPAEEPAAVPEAEAAPVIATESAEAKTMEAEVCKDALPEEPASCPEQEPAVPEPEEHAQEPESSDTQNLPRTEQEPVRESSITAPADAPEKPARKGLHFTATVSLILIAMTFLFGSIALLGLLVSMHPGIVIFMSILTILMTPLCFGFGVAAFIIGLKDKRPACWIIGLIAAVFALVSFCFGIIYLIAGVFVAAA